MCHHLQVQRGNFSSKSLTQLQLHITHNMMCIFIRREVLEQHKSDGLNRMGPIKPALALCVFAVFVLVYFSLWKGVRSTGKVLNKYKNKIIHTNESVSGGLDNSYITIRGSNYTSGTWRNSTRRRRRNSLLFNTGVE